MNCQYDVIVCGGGPAGVCAAIAAAREGAQVLILEQQNCLGGIWTAGLLGWFLDVENKRGIITEIMNRMMERESGRFARGNSFICESEALKYALDGMCLEAGVDVRLHTFITGVQKEKRMIKSVVTHSKSGREEFSAKIFIDATGDGDVGFHSGCEYEWGKEETHQTQPMSMIALVNGLPYEQMTEYDNALEYKEGKTPKQLFREAMDDAGLSPSQGDPALYHLYHDVYLFSINHEYGYKGTDAQNLTKATMEARKEINEMVSRLSNLGGRWENIKLVTSAQAIGVREGRRITGLYRVSRKDIENYQRHEDGVCEATFCIDIHSLSKEEKSGYNNLSDDAIRAYDIPLRALIAKDMDNLMMAGRCISGDFYAHSSYRVTGNAAVMGEQCGRIATKCALQNMLPKEYQFKED